VTHQRNEDNIDDDEADDDVTNDVIVTSDGGGKRRNKTWRRPAVDNVERKQTDSSAPQPNTGGL